MRIFFRVAIIQIVLGAYIFWKGWQILPAKKYIRISYIAFFALEFAIYFTGFFASTHLPTWLMPHIAWISLSWTVFSVYFSGLLLLYDVIFYLNKKIHFIPDQWNLKSLKVRIYYFYTSFLLIFAVMLYGNYRFWHPVVTELSLEIEKESPGIKDLKIVMVSDVHVGSLIDKKILSMYIDKIMEQNADMIVLVGDIIDYDLESVKNQTMQEEFLRLKAPYGVYACTGNHEYIWVEGSDIDYKIKWLEKEAKLNVLRDSLILINNSFNLVGREDDNCKTRKSLNKIIESADKKLPIIVLNHEPHNLKEESDANVDLALYGHTHNGQLFPYNFVMSLLYEVPFGYKKKDKTHIYVSSGLGLTGPQYRIGTISEIVVLNLKFIGKSC